MPFFLYIVAVVILAPIYALAPKSARPSILLAASLLFYGSFNWTFLLLLAGVIGATYFGGLLVHRFPDKTWLTGGFVLAILTPLAFYKYLLFWVESLRWSVIPTSGLDFGGFGAVLIPVGLSFFTFQCLGYVIDIHRKAYVPETNPVRVGLFVSFFPQLLAGPIERFPHLSRQLTAAERPSADMVLDGLMLMFYGLFLKSVLGDRLATSVDVVYGSADHVGAWAALFGMFGFLIELFADFGGYSLIAVGAAKLFGVELTRNFKQPFFSSSIAEFWQRWHISLTRWIGDYLYRPLGRKLVGFQHLPRFWQEGITLFLVWVIMGMWHGATLSFLIFGLAQAAMLIAYNSAKRGRRRKSSFARTFFGMTTTMLLVAVTFSLIRAPSLETYAALLTAITDLRPGEVKIVEKSVLLTSLLIVLIIEALRRFRPSLAFDSGVWMRCVVIAILVLSNILFGHDQERSFIYFRY